MSTRMGSGASALTDTRSAIHEALRQALAGLGPERPQLGWLFASPRHDLGLTLALAREAAPQAELLACTTAGEFTERGLTRGGLSLMLLGGQGQQFELAQAGGLTANPAAAAQALCAGFAERSQRALQAGLPFSTTLLLGDGLSSGLEKLPTEVRRLTRPMQQVVGGAAGDDGALRKTWVGSRAGAASDAAVALHVFGPRGWGVGVDHGLRPASKRMMVTRSAGSVVHELDGKPAFQAYREHAQAQGLALDASTAGEYLIRNELGIYFLDNLTKARAPLKVGADGSLQCAGEVPSGSAVCILSGEPEPMLAAARSAALEARENLQGAPAAGVLVFDCICRGMLLERRFDEEIRVIREVFGEVPVAGFLTYGEIARFKGRLDGFHNTTAVVAAIPA